MALWTPTAKKTPHRKALICAVPGCDHPPFPMDQQRQWSRHVCACIKKHETEIQETYHEHRSNPLKSIEDREQFGWLRRRAAERKEQFG